MANNPYINKVVYGNSTLIDISDTTATEYDVAEGKYFYAASGEKKIGTATTGAVTVVETPDPHGGTIVTITGEVVKLQTKTVTPTTSTQSLEPDTGYTGMSIVTVNPIPSQYIVPSGTKSITANGTGIDVASYAEVDVSVTPTINLQDKTVDSSTSQQVVEADSQYDGLNSVTVNAMPVGSATTPATTITANPSISVNTSTGLITATASASESVTPTVSAGYVSSGTSGTITVSGSGTSQLSTQNAVTATPTESEQTIVSAGKYTLGAIKVSAISSTYVGSGIDRNDSDDLTVSGATVTAPAGYYAESASRSISSGSISASATGSATVSSLSLAYDSTNGDFDVSGSSSISGTATATVGTAGYVSSGATGSTTGTATVSANIPKIVGTTEFSGTTTFTPAINRTTTTATGATNVGTGSASTTKPSSGYFVSVKSNANTGTITATPTVSTSGYGTSSNHEIAANSTTVGANASSETYITVSGGSATTPTTSITANPTISVNSSTGVITASVSGSKSITPTISSGYITSGTAGTVSVSGSNTSNLSTQAAATITPTKQSQTAVAAGKYTLGAVTVAAIPASYQDVSSVDATASDVVSGKKIVNSSGTVVTGELVIQHYYTGSGTPSSSTGVNGDIYLKTS